MQIWGAEILFEHHVKIKLEILKLLETTPNSWVSLDFIEKHLNISKPTLLKYLKIIQKEQTTTFEMNYSKSQGVQLVINDSFLFGHYYRSILFNMWPIQLVYRLLSENKVNKIKFCEDYFISSTSLEEKINKINKIGQNFDVTIKGTKGDYVIYGDEALIRRLLEELLWEIFKGYTWPFDYIDENKIKDVVNDIYSDSTVKFSVKRLVEYRLAIILIRYNNSNVYKLDIPLLIDIFENNTQFNSIKKTLLSSLFLPYREVEYFYLSLLAHRNVKPQSAIEKTELFKLNRYFHSFFYEELSDFDIQTNEKLDYFLLSIHIFCLLYKNTNHIYSQLRNQRQPNLIITKLASSFYYFFIQKQHGKFKNNQNFLVHKYELIICNLFPQDIAYPLKYIAVDTDMNMLEEQKLIHFLNNSLNTYSNVLVDSIQNLEIDSVDILVYTNKNNIMLDFPNKIYIDRSNYMATISEWFPLIIHFINKS